MQEASKYLYCEGFNFACTVPHERSCTAWVELGDVHGDVL